MQQNSSAFRSKILHFRGKPHRGEPWATLEYFEDGVLVVEGGLITQVGSSDVILPNLPSSVPILDYRNYLLAPGFVDAHVHYVQADVIAAFGKQLLDWLNDHTFPAEGKFCDSGVSQETADWFLRELWRNGTTTAMVMSSSHKVSTEEIFKAASKKHMRMIAGKVMMDRNCPKYLADTPESSYEDSCALIESWHQKDRLLYAVTPRFAPTSSERQLKFAGRLLDEYPDVFMQTHLAENHGEIAWVAELFPNHRSYLDVYDDFGLLKDKSFFAHCIHLDDQDRQRLFESGATAVFCPTSNLFLGSGLFDLKSAEESDISITLGTDVGGGTSFGLLQTMHGAYSVTQLGGFAMHPAQGWYWATLGGAEALGLADKIGNFAVGKEADFIVLDPQGTPLLERRMQSCEDLYEQLFSLMVLGDDRAIKATYVFGDKVHDKAEGYGL